MEFPFRGLLVLALGSVCCSLASASATCGAGGYSSTYLLSASGADITLSFDYSTLGTGLYALSYGSSVDGSTAWTDNATSNSTFGWSAAYPIVGGSYDMAEEFSKNVYSLTNTNQTEAEYAILNLDATFWAGAGSDGNGYAEAWAYSTLENLSTDEQFIAEDFSFSGENVQSFDSYYFYDSDAGNNWSRSGLIYSGADTWTQNQGGWGGAALFYLAPGQTDYIETEAASFHIAYSTTPAPAALATFGLALIASMRRRRRS
jgi:MYXO-CTERM domain-containing protein